MISNYTMEMIFPFLLKTMCVNECGMYMCICIAVSAGVHMTQCLHGSARTILHVSIVFCLLLCLRNGLLLFLTVWVANKLPKFQDPPHLSSCHGSVRITDTNRCVQFYMGSGISKSKVLCLQSRCFTQ